MSVLRSWFHWFRFNHYSFAAAGDPLGPKCLAEPTLWAGSTQGAPEDLPYATPLRPTWTEQIVLVIPLWLTTNCCRLWYDDGARLVHYFGTVQLYSGGFQ